MIVVTGALGFIGSCLIRQLNKTHPKAQIIAVDDFYKHRKEINIASKSIHDYLHRDLFRSWLQIQGKYVDCVFHLGARTDTISKDRNTFKELNEEYTKRLWNICCEHNIKFIYASSAATYGDGTQGFDDDHALIPKLKPLNEYAHSKQNVDQWILNQESSPANWYGLKFFNVYGPNEYHKKKMASVVYNAFRQIKTSHSLNLFKSHKTGIINGEQKRDFIYIQDVLDILIYTMETNVSSGIYNVGTGHARSFNDLAEAVFNAMDVPLNINYIDTPIAIRQNYQYFTEANITKLKATGYKPKMSTLEEGISTYISQFLLPNKYF